MRNIAGILLLLITSISCYAQVEDKRLDGLENEIEQLMEAFHAVGLSVAVIENDQVIFSKGFGYRDLEQKIPVTTKTLFGLGSVTKQFTSCLIGIYEEQEKLSVQDRPVKHIEDINFNREEMNRSLTIDDLLTHRSGLGNMDGAMVFFPKKDLTQNLHRLPHLVPSSSFRGGFSYSNMGYSILGSITEAVTKKSWSENMEFDLFKPLEMNQSNTSILELKASDDYSLAYSVHEQMPVPVLFDELYECSPGGSINSSAEEMSNWTKMLLSGGQFKGKQIVPKKYLEQAFTGHSRLETRFSFEEKDDILFDMYGYGWAVHSYLDNYKVWHAGAVSGFTSSIDLYPFKNLGIVVLTNQHLSNIGYHISDIIARRMLGLEVKKWSDYPVEIAPARLYNEPMAPLNAEEMPSLALKEYCGKYSSPGYGTIEVSQENGLLFATFPAFKLGFEHDSGDVFYNKSITPIHQNCPSFNFTFLVEGGEVKSVSAFLQEGGVVFEKKDRE